jgi:hypothetical protein
MDWATMNESNWTSMEKQSVYRFADNLDATIALKLNVRDGIELEDLQADPDLRQWLKDWQLLLLDQFINEELPISLSAEFENEMVKLEVDWGLDWANVEAAC